MAGPLMVVAHPSPDVYGSDRQLLVTLDVLIADGWDIVVALPDDGPLVPLLRDRPVRVVIERFPVLRKSLLNPQGVLKLGVAAALAIARHAWLLRRVGADAVLVNTLTIPTWLVGARLARVPPVCHVHEAEEDQRMLVRRALAAQLLLTRGVIVNSAAAGRALTSALPALDRQITVVHNGVPGPDRPPTPPRPRQPGDPARIALIGRLSPRKGIDVAVDAVARLRGAGREVTMEVCGTAFPGYEWYEQQLRDRIARSDLAGSVHLVGYRHPTWPVLAVADVVLVPSRQEPFGNAAVEGLLAGRPVVASAVQGLREVIDPGRTGLLVPPDDPGALAAAVAALLDDPTRASHLAAAGRHDATRRFAPARYAEKVLAAVAGVGIRPVA